MQRPSTSCANPPGRQGKLPFSLFLFYLIVLHIDPTKPKSSGQTNSEKTLKTQKTVHMPANLCAPLFLQKEQHLVRAQLDIQHKPVCLFL